MLSSVHCMPVQSTTFSTHLLRKHTRTASHAGRMHVYTYASVVVVGLIARDRRMRFVSHVCQYKVTSPTSTLKGATHSGIQLLTSAAMSSLSEDPDLDADAAEPFRFHFEVAYEVANKGMCVRHGVCTRAGCGWAFLCRNPASVWVTDEPGYV